MRPTRTPSTRRPSPSPSPGDGGEPRTVTRTFTLRGGSAAVSCTGQRAVLKYASPNAGYIVDAGRSGDEVEVRFRSDDHESRLRVECVGDTPHGDIREED